MAIPRITFFDFLFNGGRGIRTTQVDWSVSDPELNALLSNLGAAGNTAFALDAAPDDADGSDGDIAIARISATELRGYKKESGSWTQVWTFGGGGSIFTATEKDKLGGIAAAANRLVPYKIGNIYRAFASGATVTKPGNTEGVVTASGITDAPDNWLLARPEATEALPHVYDCHVYGYDTNGIFSWQFGTPNRTDRYIAASSVRELF